ncbi:MAG: dCTP deaminase [Dehalococcoidia bacterium]
MILSDGEIWDALESGELEIDPLPQDGSAIQPSSIDLLLDPVLRVQREDAVKGIVVDPTELDVVDYINRFTDPVDLSDGRPYEMRPGAFVIGQTKERIRLPLNIAARVEGKSSLARLGVSVHFTAPKIDPGYDNRITLELYNFGPFTIRLSSNMKICVLIVERLGQPAKQGYRGRFQGTS